MCLPGYTIYHGPYIVPLYGADSAESMTWQACANETLCWLAALLLVVCFFSAGLGLLVATNVTSVHSQNSKYEGSRISIAKHHWKVALRALACAIGRALRVLHFCFIFNNHTELLFSTTLECVVHNKYRILKCKAMSYDMVASHILLEDLSVSPVIPPATIRSPDGNAAQHGAPIPTVNCPHIFHSLASWS